MSTKKRFLTLVLTLVLVFCCLPTTAFSVDNKAVGVEESVEIADTGISYLEQETESDELIGAVSELTALREENVKHFRLSNGLYQAVTYATPVHRKDKDGVWQDIDNSLELKAVEDVKCYSTTDSRVSFASEFKYGKELLSLRENGYSIALTPVTSGKITASTYPSVTTVKNSEKRSATVFDTVEEASRVDNQTKIMYTNIEENTDIEYVLRGNDIKENIIVNAPTSSYKYSFYLNLTGLVAKLDEYGNVIVADEKTKDVKYTIPAPYMFDDNGEVSYDVYYELKESGESRYLLTVTANEKWINEEGRAFPVTIDPTVTQYNNIYDTYVNPASASTNFGSYTYMATSNTEITYVKVDLPQLPLGYTISSAWFGMPYYFNVNSGSMLVGVYPILSSWDENTVTHNTAPSVGNSLITTATLIASSTITSSSPNETSFEITSLVNQWYDGTAGNYGIALKRMVSETNTNSVAYFKSSESTTPPYLNIIYSYQIDDGVYALRNAYGSNYWMTFDGDIANGGTIQQKTSTTSPAATDVFDRTSLFKITRVGSTSTYVIRSMLNNNLTISVSGTSVVTKEIPNKDADVASRDRFYIDWTGEGYLIRPVGTSNVIAMTESFETDLTVVPKTSATVMANWSLVRYTGNHKSGATIYFPSAWSNHGIIEGTDNEISIVGWSTYPDANVIEASVPQEDAVLGGIEWDSTTRRGTFSAYSPGRVTVVRKTYHSDGTYNSSGRWEFSIVPQVGTYYIRNVGTNKYADVKGPSTAAGALIHQWDFHTGSQEKWIVEYVPNGGGYIRFKSAYSNLYLGIDPSNTAVVKQYAANNYTSWRIDRTASGNYMLINKATESTNKVLAVPSSGSSANGTNLTQFAYSDNSDYNDEWQIYALSPYTVNLEVIYDQAYNTRYANASTRISNELAVLQEKFMMEFGITVLCSSPTIFSSYADLECTASYNEACPHADDTLCFNTSTSRIELKNLHHNNFYNILSRIQFPNTNQTLKTAFVGHDTCYAERDKDGNFIDHHCNTIFGYAYYDLGLSMIANFESDQKELKTLIHEFGHHYNVLDHYSGENATDNIDPTGELGYSRDCIWGENKEKEHVLQSYTICDGCRKKIEENISKYNH